MTTIIEQNRQKEPQEINGSYLTLEGKKLVVGMLRLGAIRFGDFKWTYHNAYPNAPLAPMYFELRMIRRDSTIRNLPVDILQDKLVQVGFNMVADVPTAITPTVAVLAERLRAGMVSPRMEPKKKGSSALVDGFLPEDKGKTVVLIDDVLSRGDSKLVLAENLKKVGAVVKDIVILMDYEIGGRSILEKSGYIVHSSFTAKLMLDYFYSIGKIDKEEYERTLNRLLQMANFFEGIDREAS